MAGPGRPGPGKASPGRPGLAKQDIFLHGEGGAKTTQYKLALPQGEGKNVFHSHSRLKNTAFLHYVRVSVGLYLYEVAILIRNVV